MRARFNIEITTFNAAAFALKALRRASPELALKIYERRREFAEDADILIKGFLRSLRTPRCSLLLF